MKKRKITVDMVQRRLYLATVQSMGVVLYTISHEYYRAWRFYSAGLTPGEQEYVLKRQVQMKQVADDMSVITNRIRNHLNGTKG